VATVRADFAGAEHSWKGYVIRTTGQVDKATRLVSVVVEVPEPFEASETRPPLLPGMFVEVLIEGRVLREGFAVPRDAIHEGNRVWVVEYSEPPIKQLTTARLAAIISEAMIGADPIRSLVSGIKKVEATLSEQWIIPYERLRTEKLTKARLGGLFAGALAGADYLEILTEAAQHIIYELWVVNNARLHIRPLEILRTDKGFAYISSALDHGVHIAVSALDSVTDGMTVRTHSKTRTATNVPDSDISGRELEGVD
jgi:hypothetical protein